MREVERDLAERAAAAEQAANAPPTFRAVAHAYLDWLERVRGAKPATLRDHRYLLAEPGAAHRRGSRAHRGVIMAALGDRPAGEITTRDVNRLLGEVAATGASPRTINKHRQLVCAIFSFGGQEATFALPRNPARAADRRTEPERARLDYYSPEEVEALARALAEGRHRDPNGAAVSAAEAEARADEDRQDGELVRVAAYAGLRRGELVALRWRDVDFERRKLVVRRAVSGDVEASSTKSRRAREVPLADQAAGALARLSQRADFTNADDYVFANRLGRRLDGSALRRRVERARDAAGLRPLRFHDLRHTYGSLLVAGGVDLASVKVAMGHSRITTTERYLHARSASELADRFSRALGGAETPTLAESVAPGGRRAMSELDDEHAVRTTDADGREVVLDASTRLHLIEGGRGWLLDHIELILATLSLPDHREDDPLPGRERFYRQNALNPGRWLRVVVDSTTSPHGS